MDVQELMGAVIFTGVIALLAGFAAWRGGLFHLKEGMKDFPSISFIFVLAAFGFYLGVQLLLAPSVLVVGYALAETPVPMDEVSQVKYSMFAMALGGAALLLFCRRKIAPYFSLFTKEFFLGGAVWFFAAPCAFFVGQFVEWLLLKGWGIAYEHQIAVKQLKLVADDHALFLLMMGVVLILAPVLEEVLFRGVLYSWLRSHLKIFPSLVISSSVFASFHMSISQGWSNLQLFASLFILSCFMGWLFERQRGLGAPIGLHFLFNFFGVLFIFNGS